MTLLELFNVSFHSYQRVLVTVYFTIDYLIFPPQNNKQKTSVFPDFPAVLSGSIARVSPFLSAFFFVF